MIENIENNILDYSQSNITVVANTGKEGKELITGYSNLFQYQEKNIMSGKLAAGYTKSGTFGYTGNLCQNPITFLSEDEKSPICIIYIFKLAAGVSLEQLTQIASSFTKYYFNYDRKGFLYHRWVYNDDNTSLSLTLVAKDEETVVHTFTAPSTSLEAISSNAEIFLALGEIKLSLIGLMHQM